MLPHVLQVLSSGSHVLDLGAGSGAWALRLRAHGFSVTAVDRDASDFEAVDIPFTQADLNLPFAARIQRPDGGFHAITAIEVIEHLENPRQFLREMRALLSDSGIILITTPNIESVPARLRFLATGRLRGFDSDPRLNDPTHISPIQTLMFERMLADTQLGLVFHGFNSEAPRVTRPLHRLVCRLVAPFLAGVKGADNHIFILKKKPALLRDGERSSDGPVSRSGLTRS